MAESIVRGKIVRAAVLLACCAAVIGGVACFTPDLNRQHRNATRNPVDYLDPIRDAIYGSATLSPALEKKLACTNGLAFLGTNRTYLVTQGGDRILAVSRAVDADRLTLETPPGTLLYYKNRLLGAARLAVKATKEEAAGELGQRLDKLGFQRRRETEFWLDIPVQGVIQEAVTVPAETLSRFGRTRPIELYRPVRDYHLDEHAAYAVKLPLAIVGDTLLVAGVIVAVPVVGVLSLFE